MLQFDPNSRVTAVDALRHAYLADHHSEEDELVAQEHVDWSFDDQNSEPSRLQCLIYHEAAARHPEILKRDSEDLLARGWLNSVSASEAAPAADTGAATGNEAELPAAEQAGFTSLLPREDEQKEV